MLIAPKRRGGRFFSPRSRPAGAARGTAPRSCRAPPRPRGTRCGWGAGLALGSPRRAGQIPVQQRQPALDLVDLPEKCSAVCRCPGARSRRAWLSRSETRSAVSRSVMRGAYHDGAWPEPRGENAGRGRSVRVSGRCPPCALIPCPLSAPTVADRASRASGTSAPIRKPAGAPPRLQEARPLIPETRSPASRWLRGRNF